MHVYVRVELFPTRPARDESVGYLQTTLLGHTNVEGLLESC
jgi:hypothetical protein